MMQVATIRAKPAGACPPRRPSRVLDRLARRIRAALNREVKNHEVKNHELPAVSVIREAEGEKHRAVTAMRGVTVTQAVTAKDANATQGAVDAMNAGRDVRPLVRTLEALKPAAMMNRDVAIGLPARALPMA